MPDKLPGLKQFKPNEYLLTIYRENNHQCLDLHDPILTKTIVYND